MNTTADVFASAKARHISRPRPRLPPLTTADTQEAYDALQNRAIARYLKWVADQQFVTMEPWMERAMRERTASFTPPASRNFFAEITHRDPIPLWTHLYHWWDNMRIRVAPHASPIRRTALLYNVWMSRSEGMATSMEEWMMHAGLYDDSPRSRELVWIMLLNRAARGLGNLYAHANDLTMEQAEKFLTKMYRTDPDFVFTVGRDFVRQCQTPVLILPDDIPAHPYAVAMESAMLTLESAARISLMRVTREGSVHSNATLRSSAG